MAFARTKTHWAKMDVTKLMTEGPPEGKEHHRPEMYYDSVMKGSRLMAEQCSKDIISPESIILSCPIIWNKVLM